MPQAFSKDVKSRLGPDKDLGLWIALMRRVKAGVGSECRQTRILRRGERVRDLRNPGYALLSQQKMSTQAEEKRSGTSNRNMHACMQSSRLVDWAAHDAEPRKQWRIELRILSTSSPAIATFLRNTSIHFRRGKEHRSHERRRDEAAKMILPHQLR